ncbi:MAG: hypothetical protein RIS70_4357, partial [Planctomycetota bacterium]
MHMEEASNRIHDRLEEGINLSNRGEYLDALKVLMQCVQEAPGDPEAVDAFLTHLSMGPPTPETGTVPVPAPAPTLLAAIEQGNAEILQQRGPAYLAENPHHLPTLRALSATLDRMGHFEAALRYLEAALVIVPLDRDIGSHKARLLEKVWRFEESLQAWRALEKQDLEDRDTAAQVARLVILAGRQRATMLDNADRLAGDEWARRPPKPSKAGILPRISRQPRTSLPQQVDSNARPAATVRLTPIQQLQNLIREYPINADLHLQLAALLLEKGRDYDAEQALTKAKELTEGDTRIVTMWEDVTILRIAKKIDLVRAQLQLENSERLQAELEDLYERRTRFELQVYQQRSDREPQDMQLRLELGRRLRQAGRHRDAVRCFEAALQDPAQQPAAALELASHYEESHDLLRALPLLRRAAETAVFPQQIPAKVRALER